MLRAGYTGPLSLEIFNDVFRETPNRRTAVDAMRSLLYLESQVRQRLAARAGNERAPRRSARRRHRAVRPAGGAALVGRLVHGIRASTRRRRRRSAGCSSSSAFARAGRHRSQAGRRCTAQGDINLIVNAQPDSFARARFDAHGAVGVRAGVATHDAARAVERATALRSARFDAPLGPQRAADAGDRRARRQA